MGIEDDSFSLAVDRDPNCLALLKYYASLMQMAEEARKPMFKLQPADGALGAHFQAVQQARKDFSRLAQAIAFKAGIRVSASILS